jgi:nucleotide-binding universal stress UspA family protein
MKARIIHRILLCYNGSASATNALMFADRLARSLHAKLHIVAVAQPPGLGAESEVLATIEQARRKCRQALRMARLKLSHPAHVRVSIGDPARQILRYAQAHRIDHIIVGHRSRVLLGYARMSSVAREVAALACCPVTVVPNFTAERGAGRRGTPTDKLGSEWASQRI